MTAQRRHQPLQDVGMSISVLGREALDTLDIDDFESLSGFVPGLQVSPGLGTANPVFTIRGIGSTIIWSNNSPSVAVYVDDVYRSSPAFMSLPFFDLERIEVLKGPQATLYGRNSSAGAVNVITALPSGDAGFQADVKVGTEGTTELTAVAGGELTEQLAGRFSVYRASGGGYQKTSGPGGISEGFSPLPGAVPEIPPLAAESGYGDVDRLAARGALRWTPGDRWETVLSLHVARDESDVIIDRLRNRDTLGFEPSSEDPYRVYNNRDNPSDSRQYGGVLRTDFQLDGMQLSSITGFERIDRDFFQEDGSPFRITDGEFSEELSSLTQEFHLSSTSTGTTLWMLGAFASRDDVDFIKDIRILDVLRTVIATEFEQEDRAWALFGHGEWQFAPAWRLTGGLRYTDESKTYRGGSFDRDPWGVTTAGGILPGAIDVNRRYEDAKVTGRLGVDYSPSDAVLWYGSISQGYKSGGFDGSLITSEASTRPYGAETVWAYEVGAKYTLRHDLQLNAAAFFYDYVDKQVQATVDIGGGLTEAIIENAAESESYGAELELRWLPAPWIETAIGASWLATEITGWESADPAEAESRVGNDLPNAPDWTAFFALQLQRNLGGTALFGTVNVTHSAGFFREVDNNPDLASDHVTLVGAEVGIRDEDRGWSVYLWGDNLGDEKSRLYSRRPLGAMITDQYASPRVVGLGVKLRFGFDSVGQR